MDKRGSEKYYIIASLILGLLVLGITLYFIFQEYFNEDEISWETCRQSIILRNSLPEKEIFKLWGDTSLATTSSKDLFPLRCKTEVINIDYEDKKKAEKTFADSLAACSYLLGDGKLKFYPATKLTGTQTHCFICARIHLDSKVKSFYTGSYSGDVYSGKNVLDLEHAITFEPYYNGKNNYWDYFTGKLDGEERLALSRVNGWGPGRTTLNIYNENDKDGKWFGLPGVLDPEKGDLFIIAVTRVDWRSENPDASVPYIFYVQQDEFYSTMKKEISGVFFKDKLCDSFETIPA